MPLIYHQESGKGFPVVLIHGFCENHHIWDSFVKGLPAKYRTLMPDLPGFGESPLPHGDFTLDDIAALLIEWLQSLRIDKCIIIGHSLGGYIVLAIAKYYPEILSGLGLFHSSAFPDDESKKKTRNKTIAFVEKNGVKVFAESFVQQLFFMKNRKEHKEAIDKTTAIAADTQKKSLIQYSKAMRDRVDRTEVLKTFKNPVLIIGGDKDTAVPLSDTKAMTEMPSKVMVEILKDTGHKGMFEKEKLTQQVIADFIGLVLKV